VKAAALIKLRVLPRYRVGVGPSRRLDGRSLRTLTLEEARGPGVPRCARRYQALLRANAGLVRLMAPVELVTRRSAHNVLLFGAARPNRTPLMTGTLLRKPVGLRTLRCQRQRRSSGAAPSEVGLKALGLVFDGVGSPLRFLLALQRRRAELG
jgi:hypothetical protein